MTPLILTDLDDTLFQTMEKCPPGSANLKPMSSLIDGSPSGFATAMQQHFLKWLSVGDVVPVTARGRDVLARVAIRQAPAIAANGGCILRADGALDLEWHAHLVGEAAKGAGVVDGYHALTDQLCPTRFRHWTVAEHDLPLYIVIKSNERDAAALAVLEAELAAIKPAGWRCHRNGNNLAYLPPWLSKRHAVRYLTERVRTDTPDRPIIGIGDSLSDVGFMDLCDFAMAPTRSQLWADVIVDNDWVD